MIDSPRYDATRYPTLEKAKAVQKTMYIPDELKKSTVYERDRGAFGNSLGKYVHRSNPKRSKSNYTVHIPKHGIRKQFADPVAAQRFRDSVLASHGESVYGRESMPPPPESMPPPPATVDYDSLNLDEALDNIVDDYGGRWPGAQVHQ